MRAFLTENAKGEKNMTNGCNKILYICKQSCHSHWLDILFDNFWLFFENVSNGCNKIVYIYRDSFYRHWLYFYKCKQWLWQKLNQGIDKNVTDITYVFTHVTAIAYTICK